MADATDLLQQIADSLDGLPSRIADLIVRDPVTQTREGGMAGPPPMPDIMSRPDAVSGLGAALGYSGLGVNQQLGLIRGGQQAQESLRRELDQVERGQPRERELAPAQKAESPPAPKEPPPDPRPDKTPPPNPEKEAETARRQGRRTIFGKQSGQTVMIPGRATQLPPPEGHDAETKRTKTTDKADTNIPPPGNAVEPIPAGANAGAMTGPGADQRELIDAIEELTSEMKQTREALGRKTTDKPGETGLAGGVAARPGEPPPPPRSAGARPSIPAGR